MLNAGIALALVLHIGLHKFIVQLNVAEHEEMQRFLRIVQLLNASKEHIKERHSLIHHNS